MFYRWCERPFWFSVTLAELEETHPEFVLELYSNAAWWKKALRDWSRVRGIGSVRPFYPPTHQLLFCDLLLSFPTSPVSVIILVQNGAGSRSMKTTPLHCLNILTPHTQMYLFILNLSESPDYSFGPAVRLRSLVWFCLRKENVIYFVSFNYPSEACINLVSKVRMIFCWQLILWKAFFFFNYYFLSVYSRFADV